MNRTGKEAPVHFAKRVADVLLSLIGLIVLTPFIPIIGLIIKLDSKGPVFYSGDRVGKGMKSFRMCKFRTMIVTPIEVGESLSPQYDPRVTSLGRILRRTKINELPQFWNILKGEMAFVGPRPEAPDLAEFYPEEAKSIFSIKPGLVSPGTILGRNEEEAYPPGVDAKKYYIQNILPDKIKMDLKYFQNATLFQDFKLIMMGGKETLIRGLNKKYILANDTWIYLLLSDIFLISCSYLLLYAVARYVWNLDISSFHPVFNLPTLMLVRLICNAYFHMYSCLIRYISFHDIFNVFKGVTFGSFFLVLATSLTEGIRYSGFILAIDWALLIIFLSGLRLGARIYWDNRYRRDDERQKRRILIYGLCDEGNAACRALTSERYIPFEVVGFIDDDPAKYGKIVNGKKVLGNRYHLKALAQLYRVEEILVADVGVYKEKLSEILAIAEKANLKCRTWNSIGHFASLNRSILSTQESDFSRILPPKPPPKDSSAGRMFPLGKTFLINGSGGAVGLEICRSLLQLGCRRVVIIDRYESYLNELTAALLRDFSAKRVFPVISREEEVDVLQEVFNQFRPDIVIHAAMRKYLPFLGVDFAEIARTNYLRTFNLARVTAEHQCQAFLMISSLLAARGGNFIADSLRVAEVSLQHFFRGSNTQLIIARICDIAENRGGVISIIENQIRNREAVILPSPDAETYLISKYHAAEFILQALIEGEKNRAKGEAQIFSCEAGSPIPLITISERLANAMGMAIGSDIAVTYTGKLDNALSMLPQEISSGTPQFSPPLQGGMGNSQDANADIKAFFEGFVLNHDDGSGIRDWKAWTERAIKLCASIA
jgi:FlaA1/EpsC-like NDP-sugar epimerase/lipopolysaccharide/colanic/teichoic acid biosynthesis glycosyltransferase